MTWISLPILILTALFMHMMPGWSRRDILFGVTVRPDFRQSPEGRRLVQVYRLLVWLATVAGMALVAIRPELMGLAVATQTIAVMLAWRWANRQTAPHHTPAPTRIAVDLEPRESAGAASWLLMAGPFAALAAAAVFVYLNWSAIPERIPVHWGISGAPDRWIARTVGGVYMPLVMGVIVTALMIGMIFMIRNSTPRRAGEPEEVERQAKLRAGTERILLMSGYFVAALFTYIGVRPAVTTSEQLNLVPFLSLTFGGVAVLIIASIRLAKVSSSAPSSLQTVFGDRTADECWKWGQFYYNPNDPALLVEKRFGVGYTFNFARWQAWAILGAMLAAPLIGVALS